MNKVWALLLAVAGSFMIAMPAHAFLIDGFGDDQDPIVASADNPDTGGDESMPPTSPAISINDTDFDNALRALTVTQEGSSAASSDGGEVSAEVSDGFYKYSQDTLTFGTGTVDWTFDSESFGSPLGILLNIFEADNDLGSVTFTLGTYSDTISLPEVDPSTDDPVNILFTLNGFPAGESFTTASLFVDGTSASALDLTVDFIQVPAPGVLGLLGIGLAGLAFGARRRRSM